MRKLMLAATILAIAGIAPCLARGGHGHGHGLGHHRMHGHTARAPSAPADPSQAPAMTSDGAFAGHAASRSHRRLKKTDAPTADNLNSEDSKLDQRIKSICRGC